MKEMEYWINGNYYKEKEKNITIFQKSFENEIDIPCFCYHENLTIAGNCRMCLVELNTSIKLVASCAMPLLNGMQIDTNGLRVKKARESVIEFLLINHPLDCPVCDQGGECDLQDITSIFGSDKGRYYEYSKRAVIDKEGGVFIRMIMTRCIHCTRCIRFFNEISGNFSLGMINRGGSSEVSTYIFNNLIDEMSGNVIDLCPVGALTSKPYSFVARPWELNFLESIDFLDSVCSNIRIDYLNNKVYRILPIYNKDLNEDWITNRIRFFYDSNNVQRLMNPLLKIEDGNFIVLSWLKLFFLFFFNLLKYLNINSSVLAFVGMFSDLKSISSIKFFFNSIGSNIFYSDFINIDVDFRDNFLLNNLLINLDNQLFFIFFGLNTRLESPILNSRLRKLYLLNDNLKFYGFGINNSYLNLPLNIYGSSIFKLILVLKSKLTFNKELLFNFYNYSIFNEFLKKDKFIFFFGVNFFQLNSNFNLIHFFKSWIDKNFYFNIAIIFPFVGYLSFFEYNNINYFLLNKFNFIFLSNVDDVHFLRVFENIHYFFVYNGCFFDEGVKNAKLIVPSFTFFENDFEFLNIEGRLKKSLKVLSSQYNLILDFNFFNFLNIFKDLYILNNFSIFFNWMKILKYFDFLLLNFIFIFDFKQLYNYKFKRFNMLNKFYLIEDVNFNTVIYNYYKLDVYSRNSNILHLASFDYLIRLNIFL